jgi:hypothetical protein
MGTTKNWLLTGLVMVVFCGCATPKHHPIGIFGVSLEELPRIKEVGFNTVIAHPSKQYLDAAHASGLKVLAHSGIVSGGKFNPLEARRRIEEYDRHPALWAWYLVDEPDLHGIHPQVTKEMQRTFKRGRARKPTVLVLSSGWAAADYKSADILMVDHYPVPWGPLAAFGREVRVTRTAVPDKPVGGIVQAFDWSNYPDLIDLTDLETRPPTGKELRCMAFMGLAEGANAILFYTYRSRKWVLTEHEETWRGVQQTVQELNAVADLLDAERLWFLMEDRYENGAWNSIAEKKITRTLFRVSHDAQRMSPGDYLLLVNTSPDPVEYHFRISDLTTGEVKSFPGKQGFVTQEGWLKHEFEGHDYVLLGPLP